MYYSTVALTALFAATMAPSLIAAKTVLPNLSKKGGKDADEEYDCQVHLNTGNDVQYTTEDISIFEQALMLSANEVYSRDEMHVDKISVKTAKHGPKDLMEGILSNLRGEVQVGRYIYSTWLGGHMGISCFLCRDDDDAVMDTAFLEATKKGGKKGGDKHALWEETLCDLLNQTPSFENAEDCEIVVTQNGKLEPVLGANSM
jgi:hypothetical protein